MTENESLEVYGDPLWTRASSSVASPGDTNRERVPYQATLRAIGAHMDDIDASRINLLEVADGFMVRYEGKGTDGELAVVHLRHTDLLSLTHELERKRKRRPFSLFQANQEPGGSYENILRALGFELDQAEAYSLLIDELDDGMIVTYQYLRPSEGFQARKRMVILGTDAMEAVIESAKDRRDQPVGSGMSLLAG